MTQPSAPREPLVTTLRSIAHAMKSGIPQGTFGKGGGSYNWREVAQYERQVALLFLRQQVEANNSGLTVRGADHSLIPANFPTDPIFLVVVCAAGRAEGTGRRLVNGDILYLVTAPNALAEGMVLRRLN